MEVIKHVELQDIIKTFVIHIIKKTLDTLVQRYDCYVLVLLSHEKSQRIIKPIRILITQTLILGLKVKEKCELPCKLSLVSFYLACPFYNTDCKLRLFQPRCSRLRTKEKEAVHTSCFPQLINCISSRGSLKVVQRGSPYVTDHFYPDYNVGVDIGLDYLQIYISGDRLDPLCKKPLMNP